MSAHTAGQNRIQEVDTDSTLGLRGLLSCKPNLKQEPFQTALSGSRLYCLSSCPWGAAIYGAERGAQPAGWSRLFTDLACLSGMRGRKRRRWAELGEMSEIIMKTSVSSLHICPRFPQSPSCSGGKSLLWGLIEPNKSLVSCH